MSLGYYNMRVNGFEFTMSDGLSNRYPQAPGKKLLPVAVDDLTTPASRSRSEGRHV
jgi:hypothetical protein